MNDIVEQLLSYLRGIWRNRWYAMVCAWLVCLIGWVVVLFYLINTKLQHEYSWTLRPSFVLYCKV